MKFNLKKKIKIQRNYEILCRKKVGLAASIEKRTKKKLQ